MLVLAGSVTLGGCAPSASVGEPGAVESWEWVHSVGGVTVLKNWHSNAIWPVSVASLGIPEKSNETALVATYPLLFGAGRTATVEVSGGVSSSQLPNGNAVSA